MISFCDILKDIDDAIVADDRTFEELSEAALTSYVAYKVTKNKNFDKDIYSAAIKPENISSLVNQVKEAIDKYIENITVTQKQKAAEKKKEDWNKRYAEAIKYMQQLEEEKKKIFSK